MLVNVTSAAFRFLYNHVAETDDEDSMVLSHAAPLCSHTDGGQ